MGSESVRSFVKERGGQEVNEGVRSFIKGRGGQEVNEGVRSFIKGRGWQWGGKMTEVYNIVLSASCTSCPIGASLLLQTCWLAFFDVLLLRREGGQVGSEGVRSFVKGRGWVGGVKVCGVL